VAVFIFRQPVPMLIYILMLIIYSQPCCDIFPLIIAAGHQGPQPKPQLNSGQKAEHTFVCRHIANAVLAAGLSH